MAAGFRLLIDGRLESGAAQLEVVNPATAQAARGDEFARLLTREQGKPLEQAAGEIGEAVAILRAFAAMDLPERVLRDDARDYIVEQHLPLGMVAAIKPWNHPLLPRGVLTAHPGSAKSSSVPCCRCSAMAPWRT